MKTTWTVIFTIYTCGFCHLWSFEAKDYLDSGLYEKAISLYIEELEQNPDDFQIQYQLAQAYFNSENYQAVIDLLKNSETVPEALYLKALAYNQSKQFEKAIPLLNKYIDYTELLPNHSQAQIELALAYFFCHELEQSKQLFENLIPHPIAALYLSRIAKEEQNPVKAKTYLLKLQKDINNSELIHYEINYLLGELYFDEKDFAKAISFFDQALPKLKPQKMGWYKECLYYLGWSYLRMTESLPSLSSQKEYFEKAEHFFQLHLRLSKDELVYLALGQCYLAHARSLNDESIYFKAEEILSSSNYFISKETQAQALLLRAQAASSYSARDLLYRQLTLDTNANSVSYAKSWYLRGLNDYQEGEALKEKNSIEEADRAFERANVSLRKAYELFSLFDKVQASEALKYQILTFIHQTSQLAQNHAFDLLNTLILDQKELFTSMKDPDEIYHLHARTALRLNRQSEALDFLKEGIKLYPEGKFIGQNYLLLGIIYYYQKLYDQAEKSFLQAVHNNSDSLLAGDALFWASNSLEKQQKNLEEIKSLRRQVFEQHPKSRLAPEAYFSYYSYQEYLQGNREAIKHLLSFKDLYPESPFTLNALYLIGIDYKRDRKTPEGRWIRKKSLTSAIDAFQELESIFQKLYHQNLIPEDQLEHFISLKYRATFERALANLSIADDSDGSKKRIYMEYAEDVFLAILNDFENPEHPLTSKLINKDIQEESAFWLAQTYIKNQNEIAAEKVFLDMLDRMQAAKITRGYYLARVWQEKGILALQQHKFSLALKCLLNAEDAAKGRVLSTDQRLDLWIQQSLCYQALEQMDQAILLLSKVINDNAISSLRLKAMYLRAEVYEKQGRPELARRQFEAVSKKGGDWALKAKDKLEQEYGY